MSTPPNSDPRLDQAAVTDESILVAHEKAIGPQPDDRAHYQLMPLTLLFLFSGLIFFGGTYLNLFSGHFNPVVYDENTPEHQGADASAAPKVDPLELGKKLFNAPGACVTCHQATGLGLPGAFPPLAGSEWVNGSEERVIRIVLYGVQGPIKVKGADFNQIMPPFGKVASGGFNWSDDKIAAVLTYVRQEWGNQAGAIATDKVAAIRTKEGGDHKQWTVPELEKLP